ncbi:MAG: hypothetical protein PWQ84_189 [Thermotogaceae bacterium]|jgi:hypothetical protein|nr:hypothetical protein [Thermotogaceae bacterium]
MVMPSFEEEIIRSLRNGSDLPFGAAFRIIHGRERETDILRKDIQFVANGGSALKVFLGDYGTGKTLLGRIALEKGLENNLLPIYVSEPPLNKPVESYQAMINGIITPEFKGDSLFYLLSQWSEKLISELEKQGIERGQDEIFINRINEKVLEYEFTNDFNMGLSAFIKAHILKRDDEKKKIVDWMSGRKISFNELKKIKISRKVENREESFIFLKDILKLSRAIEYSGVVIVFDELELMQDQRKNTALKGYESLRSIMDMISSKELPNLYCIWLGTPQWFENSERGVNSYLALYDRLRTEMSTTTESTVQILKPVSPEIYKDFVSSIIDIYSLAYNIKPKISLSQNTVTTLQEKLTSPFHNDKFVEMRQVVKTTVEFLDMIKDSKSEKTALEEIAPKEKEDDEKLKQFWA